MALCHPPQVVVMAAGTNDFQVGFACPMPCSHMRARSSAPSFLTCKRRVSRACA